MVDTITGFTSARLLATEAATIVGGHITGDNLILEQHDGSTVNAGNVRGPMGEVTSAALTAALLLKSPMPVYGTYTPTLTGMAIGTGGTPINTAYYTWIGGSTAGDKGLLFLEGVVRFGTTGTTLPTATALGIAFPAAYQMAQFVDTDHTIGQWTYNGGSGRSNNIINSASVSVLRLLADVISGSKRVPTATSSTVPGTWAINESIHWTACCMGAKV